VGEGDGFGVEHQARVGVSVKHVAHDRTTQTALVAGVYTQLMRAACQGVERNTPRTRWLGGVRFANA